MEKLSFRLEVFEGPLDLLLNLISKNKLNIYDIPISQLLEQYLEYLSKMHEMDLEVTCDFLVMASNLVQIKSSMLLPKHDELDVQDPRYELISTLIEYKTCKQMAKELRERSQGFEEFARTQVQVEQDMTYRLLHSATELLKAISFSDVKIQRRMPPPLTAFNGIVGRHIVSVTSKIIYVLKQLLKDNKKTFFSFFNKSKDRSEIVATFLALLELIKAKRIIVEDADNITTYINIIKGENKRWK
jgi:segregation and condensation protein A